MEAVGRELAERGHRLVGPEETAELVVLNTCAVTATAAHKSRQAIRRLRRDHPHACLVVTGCYAELSAASTRRLGVDMVAGNQDKERLVELLAERGVLLPMAEPVVPGLRPLFRTRAFLKVQDGCDGSCTYCVVRLARGPGRSRAAEAVISDVWQLCGDGYREVVLSGVHLGSYGRDMGRGEGLSRLVERVLAETPVERLRLSSVEPWDLEPDFFALFADTRLLPHLHLPLQSGCDATLARMGRRTSRAAYAALVGEARERIVDLGVSTDVMVGFPGESEQEFEQSLEFVESLAFSRLHVFRFSPREGTLAATMPGQVPAASARRRMGLMLELDRELRQRFHNRFVGRRLDVLFETRHCDGVWSGLTGAYVPVTAESVTGIDLASRVAPAEIVAATPDGLRGRVVVS